MYSRKNSVEQWPQDGYLATSFTISCTVQTGVDTLFRVKYAGGRWILHYFNTHDHSKKDYLILRKPGDWWGDQTGREIIRIRRNIMQGGKVILKMLSSLTASCGDTYKRKTKKYKDLISSQLWNHEKDCFVYILVWRYNCIWRSCTEIA